MRTTTTKMMRASVFIRNRLSRISAKTGGSPGNRTPNPRIKSPLLCLVELATRYVNDRRPAIIKPTLAQRVVITKPVRPINSRTLFRELRLAPSRDEHPPREHEATHSEYPRARRFTGLFGCGLSFGNQAAGIETQDQQQDQAHGHQPHVGRAFHEVPSQAAVFRKT